MSGGFLSSPCLTWIGKLSFCRTRSIKNSFDGVGRKWVCRLLTIMEDRQHFSIRIEHRAMAITTVLLNLIVLASVVPAISVVRNAYHLWRGNTNWSGMLGNIATDSAGRSAGAGLGKAAGAGAVVMLGLAGWPAVLLPVLAATAGYRGGRALSDHFKRGVLLRREYAALSEALRWWCLGAARRPHGNDRPR
jgi:hypothetical protein